MASENQSGKRFTVFDLETITHPRCRGHNHEQDQGIPAPVCHRIVSMVAIPISVDAQWVTVLEPIVAGLGPCGENFDLHTLPHALDDLAADCERSVVQAVTREVRANWPVLTTWNGRNFDLPALFAAAFEHGIDAGWMGHDAYRDRYRGKSHIDLQDAFALQGAGRNAKMAYAAQRLGWPGKLDVTGDSVDRLWRTGSMAHRSIVQYNALDTLQQAAILLRVLFIQRTISKEMCVSGTEQLCQLALSGKFPFDRLDAGRMAHVYEAMERFAA